MVDCAISMDSPQQTAAATFLIEKQGHSLAIYRYHVHATAAPACLYALKTPYFLFYNRRLVFTQ
jgi:hypothetical protein